MNTIFKIIFLHLLMLASQAFYMYLSNKTLMKKTRYMYFAAVPLVIAVPIILDLQNTYAYSLYEYSILFCILGAALADVICAAAHNKEYMTDETTRSFHYAFFLICFATACIGGTSMLIIIITVTALVTFMAFQIFIRKRSATEFIKSLPLAGCSLACSWALLRYIL